MKTNRKKMLLSSIAMLLVALVALGSATYAWFTISKSVYADKMKVQAIAPAGIEISNTKSSGAWTQYNPEYVDFSNTAITLNPVSWNVAGEGGGLTATPYVPEGAVTADGTGYAGTYKAVSAYGTDATTQNGSKEEYKGSYFAVYDMSVRAKEDASGNATKRTGCTAKVEYTNSSNEDASGYIRCAVVEAGTLKGTYGAAAASGNNQAVNGTAAATAKVNQTLTAYGNTVSISNIDGTGKDYKLIVWFEGYDPDCKDDNASAEGTLKITFAFTA